MLNLESHLFTQVEFPQVRTRGGRGSLNMVTGSAQLRATAAADDTLLTNGRRVIKCHPPAGAFHRLRLFKPAAPLRPRTSVFTSALP